MRPDALSKENLSNELRDCRKRLLQQAIDRRCNLRTIQVQGSGPDGRLMSAKDGKSKEKHPPGEKWRSRLLRLSEGSDAVLLDDGWVWHPEP